MNVNLTPRLSAAASLVRGGGIIADIGTDHGYLPVYLIQSGRVKGAIAADIGKMPLQNAAKTIENYDLDNVISLRLSDGLREFSEGDADEYVFAGMGGTLIAEKLAETPWIKNSNLHFVFQPQSRAEDLRKFLFENGFSINNELAVHEGRRVYITFDANYTGENKPFTDADCFIGKLPHTEDSHKHLSLQLTRLKEKYNAYLQCDRVDEVPGLLDTIQKIEGFINA
ncbi:MAG: SAM-dependent methyltransferase [Ruminococcaceae bacterium]|nr:SAM-dependent methyltransferase [Oscillospiraceae bacterium]